MAASSSLGSTYRGHVVSTRDALVLFEACLQGRINHLSRPPREDEHSALVTSGNIFIYEEHSSGIAGWTDGIVWGPARVVGNFILHRQLAEALSFPGESRSEGSKRNTNGHFRGLFKQTISVLVRGVSHHLVAYFTIQDVMAGNLAVPTADPELGDIVPRSELLDQGFLAPIDSDDLKRVLGDV
ncbi:hypothetical protein GQ53DRAFT_746647 [Thozetella sp. PMI_491]|nr:hypothetical protein GQ53DRAFT_746647 [Thozetella sp. PMI_491]